MKSWFCDVMNGLRDMSVHWTGAVTIESLVKGWVWLEAQMCTGGSKGTCVSLKCETPREYGIFKASRNVKWLPVKRILTVNQLIKVSHRFSYWCAMNMQNISTN